MSALCPVNESTTTNTPAGRRPPSNLTVALRSEAHAPLPPGLAIVQVYTDLRRLFKQVKSTGVTINRFQDKESFGFLDANVRKIIGNYISAGHEDWRRFTGFNSNHYVRHLIDINEDFELLLLCWEPGQASRIHNHADAHCWATVLDGVMVEDRYRIRAEDASYFDADSEEGDSDSDYNDNNQHHNHNHRHHHHPSSAAAAIEYTAASPLEHVGPNTISTCRPCPPLNITSSVTAGRGQGLYINDAMGLHVIRADPSCPLPGGVTLHLYSPPITRVQLYDPEQNKIVSRIPGYFSIRGQRT